MKFVKIVLKLILSMVMLAFFIVFMNVIFFNTVLSNTLLNTNYYQEVIYETDFASETRLLTLESLASEVATEYEGELAKEDVNEVVNEAFLYAFDQSWFQNTLRLFSFDIIEYINSGSGGFSSRIRIDNESVEFRRQLGRSLHEQYGDLTHEELVAYTNELEAATDLPERVELKVIIDDYLPRTVVDVIDFIPAYRNLLVLGFYIIFAVFIFVFYALGGLTSVFRWLGAGIILGTGLFAGAAYGFIQHLIIDQLSLLGFSHDVIMSVLDLVIKYSFLMWLGILILGIVTLIMGIVMGRSDKKKKVVDTQEKATQKEEQKDTVEPEIIEEEIKEEEKSVREAEKPDSTPSPDFDPFAESPPQDTTENDPEVTDEANAKKETMQNVDEPTNDFDPFAEKPPEKESDKIDADEFYKKVTSVSDSDEEKK